MDRFRDPELLLSLDAAMADEVEALAGLPQHTNPLPIGG